MVGPESKDARRLILGFDGGCAACGELAWRISEKVGDRLEIQSLHHPQVEHWRERTLGKHAPWTPTLIEVGGISEVRAWTGPRLAVRLARVLGPVSTWQVMQILAETRARSKANIGRSVSLVSVEGLSRGQFLRGIGGAALALGLLSAAASPARAIEDELDEDALFRAFSLIEDIPDSVAARGDEAARQWLKKRLDAGALGEVPQPRGAFDCARAIVVAIISNAIPVLKIRKAIKVFGGAGKLARFIRRNYFRFRRLGNSVGTSIKKTAKAVARRVLAVTGQDILSAVLSLLSLDGVRRECF